MTEFRVTANKNFSMEYLYTAVPVDSETKREAVIPVLADNCQQQICQAVVSLFVWPVDGCHCPPLGVTPLSRLSLMIRLTLIPQTCEDPYNALSVAVVYAIKYKMLPSALYGAYPSVKSVAVFLGIRKQ